MNYTLEAFARAEIKKLLSECSTSEVRIFKKMYSPDNVLLNTNMVVDKMPPETLDWALTQVERTVEKHEKTI